MFTKSVLIYSLVLANKTLFGQKVLTNCVFCCSLSFVSLGCRRLFEERHSSLLPSNLQNSEASAPEVWSGPEPHVCSDHAPGAYAPGSNCPLENKKDWGLARVARPQFFVCLLKRIVKKKGPCNKRMAKRGGDDGVPGLGKTP